MIPDIFFPVIRRFAEWKLDFVPPSGSPRNRAFQDYQRALLAEFSRPPATLRLIRSRAVTPATDFEGTFELRFERPTEWRPMPGDLVYLGWQNPPGLVHATLEACRVRSEARAVYRTKGTILEPSRRIHATAEEILTSVVELDPARAGETTWESLIKTARPIRPRLYTISRIEDGFIEVLIRRGPREKRAGEPARPGRAGGFLSSLSPGAIVTGRCLPHPHRLPACHGHGARGLVVVTGSAIAGLLVHLRQGHSFPGTWVVWGVRERTAFGYYADELRARLGGGAFGRFDLVESRPAGGGGSRVDEFLRRHAAEVSDFLTGGAWVYLSGQEAMAEAARREIAATLPAATSISGWSDSLRWIESASG